MGHVGPYSLNTSTESWGSWVLDMVEHFWGTTATSP